MNGTNPITEFSILDFRSEDSERYSVWVYDDDIPQVFEDEQPNTEEVWFRFYKFTHYYWRLFEDECTEDVRGVRLFNSSKLKMFMLRRMLCATSLRNVFVEYGKDGFLTERSLDSLMSVHPRILRTVMDKVRIFPDEMDGDEKRELEKQCSILFGKGETVQNPHSYISLYCNLMAFWDKFGMNYFDLLRLPEDVFSALKKVMNLDSMNKSMKNDEPPPRPNPPGRNRGGRHSINF